MPKKQPETTEPPARTVALRYVDPSRAWPDVPARDLYEDEIDQYDRAALLASGLYEEA